MTKQKCKWYLIEIDGNFISLIEELKNNSFSRERDWGFDAQFIESNFAEFRFIEKKLTVDVKVDPFGDEISNNYVTYSIFNFSLKEIEKDKKVLMTIKNGSLSVKKMLVYLNRILNFNFFVSKVDFDIEKIYSYISNSKEVNRFTITKASAKNIGISDSSYACIEIISNNNAFLEIEKFLDKKNYRMDKIVSIFRMSNDEQYLEISKSGSVICSAYVIQFLENYIIKEFKVGGLPL